MSFEKNNYCVVKEVVPKIVCDFTANYFSLKRQAADTLYKNYIYPSDEWGVFGDSQVDTYSVYGDVMMDTILLYCTSAVSKATNLKLIPTYSYARFYLKGNDLKKHRDRPACEFSATLNLACDKVWPIFLGDNIKIDLNPGDILVYKGTDVTHWREPFTGEYCVQTFLHYNKEGGDTFDGRPHLGLPAYTKRKNIAIAK
tara:strand:+ start:54 stop:650 length:597 start_codon:yes stop_codon:yes gene_type:complete